MLGMMPRPKHISGLDFAARYCRRKAQEALEERNSPKPRWSSSVGAKKALHYISLAEDFSKMVEITERNEQWPSI